MVERVDEGDIGPDSEETYWLDLQDPTDADRERIERARGLRLPAIVDVNEIEATSRFFVDEFGIHLRVWFLDQLDGGLVKHPVAFVLSEHCLISLTWGHVGCFEALRSTRKLDRTGDAPEAVLLKLVEIHLDWVADHLEAVYDEVDTYWTCPDGANQQYLETQLSHICRLEGHKHKVRFVLMDLQQVLVGLDRVDGVPPEAERRFHAVGRDVDSLLVHSDFISEKLDFLMNMLVSRLNLIDNRVGKILSVVALVFLPPTLIGSIYGMNFHHIPELDKPWAYPVALAAMVTSAVIPYLVFKWKRWL